MSSPGGANGPSPRSAPKTTPRILLVDANRTFLRTLEQILRSDGYELRTAADATAALAELSRGEQDLLITEISLPGLSGFDLIRRVRREESLARLPVMVITSVAQKEELDRVRELGAADLLIKPVRPQRVRERVRRVLEESGCLPRREAAPDATVGEPAPIATVSESAPDAATTSVPPAALPEPSAKGSGGLAALPEIPISDPRMREVRLPALRDAVHRVLELVGDPDTTVKQIARVIEGDPGLSRSILRVVNLPYYGLRTEVDSVGDACALLGIRDLGAICLGATISELFLVRDDPTSRDCWALCLATGYASREIGSAILLPRHTDPGIPGLLHGVGILAAVASPRIDHVAIRERVAARRCRWAEAERELLGFDHAELGGAIAREWRLAPWIGRAIECCEDPARIARPEEWAVAVASLSAQRASERAFPRHPDPAALLEELARLRPNLWEKVEPRLGRIAAAGWEQPDPAGMLIRQE